MSTITVSSTAALDAALKTAHAGDTIQLAAGTYSGVVIKNFSADGAVTITSADAGHKAVLTGLNVNHASGLNFDGLEFAFQAAGAGGADTFGITVAASSDVHFHGDSIHGTLDNDPTNDIKGIQFRGSTNVSLENSELQQLNVGVYEAGSSYVSITGDNLHDIQRDGIDSAGVSHVKIANNQLSNFYHVGDPSTGGEHPDAIQFWTTDGVASSDLTVAGNVIVQGVGRNMQGVFFRTTADNPFQNVKITDNMIVGGSFNAICVSNTHGLEISGNTVTAVTDVGQNPWVRVVNSDGVVVSQNSARKFMLDGNTHLTQDGNQLTKAVSDMGLSALTSWLAQHQGVVTTSAVTAEGLLTGASGDDNSAPAADTLYGVALTGQTLTAGDKSARLVGGDGNDHLVGGTGFDNLAGGAGDDVLTGGGAKASGFNSGDNFVFRRGSGHDVVTDFHGRDVINIADYLRNGAHVTVGDGAVGAVIDLGTGDTITLLGVHASDLVGTNSGFGYGGA